MAAGGGGWRRVAAPRCRGASCVGGAPGCPHCFPTTASASQQRPARAWRPLGKIRAPVRARSAAVLAAAGSPESAGSSDDRQSGGAAGGAAGGASKKSMRKTAKMDAAYRCWPLRWAVGG